MEELKDEDGECHSPVLEPESMYPDATLWEPADDPNVAAEKAKGMEGDEIGMAAGNEVEVKRSYEWENKYNQTHYDFENPPPKIVQGYKFNIFYPDLIDKGKAPTYHVEPGPPDSPECVLLRFHAGPPYEDIAFKIIGREWFFSHKFGFRCVFDRGVLQLNFNFKRHMYRK